jgi:Uma2 family endonuclease
MTSTGVDKMATVTESTTKLLTADEFCEFVHRPENDGRHFELERGVIIEMPPPMMPHGVVCGNAGWILNNFVRQRKRGFVCTNDTGVVIETDPDTVRGIDVSLYDESLAYSELPRKYSTRLPLLAVEVLSPDYRPGKTTRRVTEFLRRGIRLVWIVDPEARDVTVHRPGREPCVVGGDEDLTGDDVLPDFKCRASDLFRLPGE